METVTKTTKEKIIDELLDQMNVIGKKIDEVEGLYRQRALLYQAYYEALRSEE